MSSPRYLALTNIRRRSQSLPAATEDKHRPPSTPNRARTIALPCPYRPFRCCIVIPSVDLGLVIVGVLLSLGIISGVDFDPTLAFIPMVLPMVLVMAGLMLFLTSIAPSAEVGSIINGMVGILPVMLSPVFFTMEQAPLLMRWLGFVSPFRYAADGIMKSLSGRTDILTEFVVLAGIAALTMTIGFWRLKWRER